MMIAVALFSVIMVIGIGAVLSANNAHKKTQNVRAILDNLSFVMEDMSRNLRTGTNYHCGMNGPIATPLDGQSCDTITFKSVADPANVWQYAIGVINNSSKVRVYKNNSSGFIPITPLDIDINPNSGFTIIGSCSANPNNPNNLQTCQLGRDNIQPKVIIRLSGSISYQNTKTPFNLQTTVSQRVFDN